MFGKIGTIKEISRKTESCRGTVLLGSSLDPFNSYYRNLLQWAANQSRPLIAIVQTDQSVYLRRGFHLPSRNQNQRASSAASLPFVDYIIISPHVAHDPIFLKIFHPKLVVFQRDNREYQMQLFHELARRFPSTQFVIAPFNYGAHCKSNKIHRIWIRRTLY